jgi:hypothetical protein
MRIALISLIAAVSLAPAQASVVMEPLPPPAKQHHCDAWFKRLPDTNEMQVRVDCNNVTGWDMRVKGLGASTYIFLSSDTETYGEKIYTVKMPARKMHPGLQVNINPRAK